MDYNKARALQEANFQLLLSKSKDYGDKNLIRTGPSGLVTRLLDKISRVENLLDSGADPNHESVHDSFRDISNYGLIGQIMLEGGLGVEPPRMVYLAGAIDAAGDSPLAWRNVASSFLSMYGITSFNPFTAFNGSAFYRSAASVEAINRAAILFSDVLLAYIAPGDQPFGTIREIEYAKNQGLRTILVGNFENRISAYDLEIYSDLDHALAAIVDSEGLSRVATSRIESNGSVSPEAERIAGD